MSFLVKLIQSDSDTPLYFADDRNSTFNLFTKYHSSAKRFETREQAQAALDYAANILPASPNWDANISISFAIDEECLSTYSCLFPVAVGQGTKYLAEMTVERIDWDDDEDGRTYEEIVFNQFETIEQARKYCVSCGDHYTVKRVRVFEIPETPVAEW